MSPTQNSNVAESEVKFPVILPSVEFHSPPALISIPVSSSTKLKLTATISVVELHNFISTPVIVCVSACGRLTNEPLFNVIVKFQIKLTDTPPTGAISVFEKLNTPKSASFFIVNFVGV